MKRKTKIALISLLACAVLSGGVTLAFYNTRSVGYEEEVKIVSRDKEKIRFLDFEIYYKDVENFLDTANRYMPQITTF